MRERWTDRGKERERDKKFVDGDSEPVLEGVGVLMRTKTQQLSHADEKLVPGSHKVLHQEGKEGFGKRCRRGGLTAESGTTREL
jgi:hypothetical protein